MGQCPARRRELSKLASDQPPQPHSIGASQGNHPQAELSKAKRRRQNAKAKHVGAAEPAEPSVVPSGPPATIGGLVQNEQRLLVCGPSKIQTLRGRLLDREVVLICCSEAHEDAIDLTREKCVTEAFEGWAESSEGGKGLDPAIAWMSKDHVTMEAAKAWAAQALEEAEDEESSEDDDDEYSVTDRNDVVKDGAILAFVAQPHKSTGSASLFSANAERRSWHRWPSSAIFSEFGDLDAEARAFKRRRKRGDEVPVSEYDALIARRKLARRADGIEMFDDWLLRHFGSGGAHWEFVFEAPVPADEVELHIQQDVAPSPPAHDCLRQIELDSESDSDDEHDGGSDAYIDYLRRQVQASLPRECIHAIDPRELGEGSEEASLRDAFQKLLLQPLPRDTELVELDKLRAKQVLVDGSRRSTQQETSPAVPSFEAYFGCAADLLYYHPEVKADFTPFLTQCVGSADALRRFFAALFFETVPEALAQIKLADDVRPFTRLRSLAFQPQALEAALLRRPSERPRIPVKAMPVDRFLKARGTEPPRTWVSALAERVRSLGAEATGAAARAAFEREVERLLADPKAADKEGDYFEAWLRECHPQIYDDIDTDDPAALRKLDWAPSERRPNSKKHRHNLRDIRIPGIEAAFAELHGFDPEARVSTRRERVLTKILVDAFMLRLVDLAAILKTTEVVARRPAGSKVIVVLLAGGDHTELVVEFWKSQGFSNKGLSKKGLVGKDDFQEDEPRGLQLPSCLHSPGELFPVPT